MRSNRVRPDRPTQTEISITDPDPFGERIACSQWLHHGIDEFRACQQTSSGGRLPPSTSAVPRGRFIVKAVYSHTGGKLESFTMSLQASYRTSRKISMPPEVLVTLGFPLPPPGPAPAQWSTPINIVSIWFLAELGLAFGG